MAEVDKILKCIVSDIALPIRNALVGGPFGSDLVSADYVPNGVPVIRGQNLSVGKYVGGEFVFVSDEKATKLSANLARPGDLVFTQRGNAVLNGGQVAIVPNGPFDRYLVSQSQMKLSPDPAKVDSQFLYFIFSSDDYRHYLRSNAIVTGVPHINLGLLRNYALSLPPLSEQRAIAHILGTLDDKVELNRRMNATLEAMAQALFKSWFVDFDPVKAKAAGRAPEGMDANTAALFPSEFHDSQLGTIPKGWSVSELRELVQQRNQRTKAGAQTESIPYVPIECITSKSIFLADYKDGLEAQSSLTLFYSGDILFGAMRPYFHKVCLAPFDGVTRTTAFVLQPRRKKDTMFSLFTIFQDSTIEYATLHSEGSTIPYAKWEGSLERMKILLPPEEVRNAFGDNIVSLWLKGSRNLEESRNLTKLRDALLPRLISGQLRIPDIEIKEGGIG